MTTTRKTEHRIQAFVGIGESVGYDVYCSCWSPESPYEGYCQVKSVKEAEEWHREHLLEVR